VIGMFYITPHIFQNNCTLPYSPRRNYAKKSLLQIRKVAMSQCEGLNLNDATSWYIFYGRAIKKRGGKSMRKNYKLNSGGFLNDMILSSH